MNALLRNGYTERWKLIGASLPRPKAILCVSAHWYISDAAVTVSRAPRTIDDFGGFPAELYQVQYPAPGDPELAARIRPLLVRFDRSMWLGSRHMGSPPPCLSARSDSRCPAQH